MARPVNGYRLQDNARVVGTTTVSGIADETGGLLRWAFDQGKAAERGEIQGLYDKRDEAAEIGTVAHNMTESHIKGDDPTVHLENLADEARTAAQRAFDSYLEWERMTRLKITHQEIPLVCPKYRFGGTPDAIGLIDGDPCLIDWKTSKGVYTSFLIQLGAYGHLIEHGLQMEADHKPLGIKVKGYHLIKFGKEWGNFSHHYYPDLNLGWKQFKLLLSVYENRKTLKRMAA